MEENVKKYIFVNGANGDFRCPNCGERLEPVDLEAFHRCSFCNWEFQEDERVEEFILTPIVHSWESTSFRNFPAD